MARTQLSKPEARRIAITAQGLHRPRPERTIDQRQIRRVINSLGLLQLDFVNVLVPAHYLVVFSRLGAYERGRFEKLVYDSADFTEQWAHEASIVPAELWPVLEHRRQAYKPWANSSIMKYKQRSRYLSDVLQQIKDRGPVTSADLPPVAGPKRKPGEWHRSVPRAALEYHFGSGSVAVRKRLPNFQRVYDLPERLLELHHRSIKVTEEEARRELLRRAAIACGVGTARDLADYYRMTTREATPRLNELVEEGAISEVHVEGCDEVSYLASGTRLPREVSAASLLSPFDPLIWFRPRAERIFDFHYRIEIYVPERKRKWGYYVLPFLLGDQLVARVDLKAERTESRLLVRAAYLEEGGDELHVANALARELRNLAGWLELTHIRVARRGSLTRPLRSALANLSD